MAGFNSFPCSSQVDIVRLNLPTMDPEDTWEFFLLAGGEFTLNKAMGILTACREWELRQQRGAALLGSTQNYTQLASQLPQTLPVYFFEQHAEPGNYDGTIYGQWPGPCVVLKMPMPSSNRSLASAVSHRCVTLIISQNPISPQPFNLQGHLSRYFGHHCTCESGMRTNSACEHIQAVNVLLFNPQSFRTAKRKETRISDVRRPDDHRPIYGTPAGQRNRQVQLQPAPRPPPRTRDKRQQKRIRDFGNFPGDQPRPMPTASASTATGTARTTRLPTSTTTTGTTRATRPPRAIPATNVPAPHIAHNSGLGRLLNLGNTCFAIVIVQLFSCIDLHNNIVVPPLPGNLQTLANQVVNIGIQRANANIPPFSIVHLVNDLNACLGQQQQFVMGQQHGAPEFLYQLVDKLIDQMTPLFLQMNFEAGNCALCGLYYMQASQSLEAYALMVAPPQQNGPVSVSALVLAKLAAFLPPGQLQCTGAGPCHGLQIQQVRVLEQPGTNKIVHISRNTNHQVKHLTPIIEPLANDPAWQGKYCKCVVGHCGRDHIAGHWIAFVKQGGPGGVWYKLDDNHPITIQNPFDTQLIPVAPPSAGDFTIDLLVFTI